MSNRILFMSRCGLKCLVAVPGYSWLEGPLIYFFDRGVWFQVVSVASGSCDLLLQLKLSTS